MSEEWGCAPDDLEERLSEEWVQRWRVLREMRAKAQKHEISKGRELL